MSKSRSIFAMSIMTKQKTNKMKFFLTATSEKSGYKGNVILDEKAKPISVEAFKKLHKAGKVTDINLSLQRLIEFGYDFDKLNNFYSNQ